MTKNSTQLIAAARIFARAAILLSAICLTAHPAQAQEIDIGTAAQYAGFFFGNASNIPDIGGRLAVGGDVSLNGFSIAGGVASSSTQPSLVVGGNVVALGGGSIGSSSSNNYGVYLGSKAPAVPTYLNLKKVTYSPVDFAAERTYLTILSQQLKARAATGTISQQWNTVTATGSNSDIEIFNLTAAQVVSTLTLALVNVKSSATLIFNVASNSQRQVQFGITASVLQGRQGKVLYNLPDADVLNFTNVGVLGSVLAPLACVTNSNGHLEGTIIAASWNSGMEIGNSPFQPTN